MKYLIQNQWSRRLMTCIDFVLKLSIFHRRHFAIVHQPEKILISNIAFLGDVVISTAALRAIKRKYPDAKIGMLVATKSELVAKNHPLVTWVHLFDHWYVKRSLRSIWRHWKMQRRALKEIKGVGYDVAIELHPYFPNAIPLLYNTQIPIRIGYESGGFGSLLTHPHSFHGLDCYIGHSFLRLLQVLHIRPEFERPLPYYPINQPNRKMKEPYIVIHMGTSSLLKEWSLESWKELLGKLSGAKHILVFTGQGEREGHLTRAACSELKNGIDLTNRLGWMEFVQVVQQAKLLISVDSVSVHVAAAAEVPTIALYCGISAMAMWLPPYPKSKGLMRKVPCAPCFNKRGCPSMNCIREISPEQVFEIAGALL